MKRTRSINLERMRKLEDNNLSQPTPLRSKLKPLAVSVAAAVLVACSDGGEEAVVYSDIADCISKNPDQVDVCESAYNDAVNVAQESGPKYTSLEACTYDFGNRNCVPYQADSGQNWFIPAVAGFMLAEVIDEVGDAFERRRYRSAPLYTSYSRYSPFYGQWSSVDGHTYGTSRYGKIKVSDNAFKPKPKITRTISRGGFGSTVAAKSNWGGSSKSKGGWGSSKGGWGG